MSTASFTVHNIIKTSPMDLHQTFTSTPHSPVFEPAGYVCLVLHVKNTRLIVHGDEGEPADGLSLLSTLLYCILPKTRRRGDT